MKLFCFRLTEFDGAVHAQQDVVTLDVSVNHLIAVEELQSLQTLERKRDRKRQQVLILLFMHHLPMLKTQNQVGIKQV